MVELFTAVSVNDYRKIMTTKDIPLTTLKQGEMGISFAEDRAYWIQKIQDQDDLDDVEQYQYALLIAFEVEPSTINKLIEGPETGRFSPKMKTYYQQLKKPQTIPTLNEEDKDVLCLLDAYESEETDDGISQAWLLKVSASESAVWQRFLKGVHKITCIGGIPGAMEAAKE